jgi:hypothetical protein
MGQFDQVARQTCKLTADAFFGWLFRRSDPAAPLTFAR